MNISKAITIKNEYNVLSNVKGLLQKVYSEFDVIGNSLLTYEKMILPFTKIPDTKARAEKQMSAIKSFSNTLNERKKLMDKYSYEIQYLLSELDKNMLYKQISRGLYNSIPYINTYVENSFLEKHNKAVRIYNELQKLSDTSLLKNFINNLNIEIKDLTNLAQNRGLVSQVESIKKGYDEWKGYIKYALIVAGVGVMGLYLTPFLKLIPQRKEK